MSDRFDFDELYLTAARCSLAAPEDIALSCRDAHSGSILYRPSVDREQVILPSEKCDSSDLYLKLYSLRDDIGGTVFIRGGILRKFAEAGKEITVAQHTGTPDFSGIIPCLRSEDGIKNHIVNKKNRAFLLSGRGAFVFSRDLSDAVRLASLLTYSAKRTGIADFLVGNQTNNTHPSK